MSRLLLRQLPAIQTGLFQPAMDSGNTQTTCATTCNNSPFGLQIRPIRQSLLIASVHHPASIPRRLFPECQWKLACLRCQHCLLATSGIPRPSSSALSCVTIQLTMTTLIHHVHCLKKTEQAQKPHDASRNCHQTVRARHPVAGGIMSCHLSRTRG